MSFPSRIAANIERRSLGQDGGSLGATCSSLELRGMMSGFEDHAEAGICFNGQNSCIVRLLLESMVK